MKNKKNLTEPDHKLKGWPNGIPFIIGNEGCERFSYYGMKAILYVYVMGLFINLRGLSEQAAQTDATQITHLFNSAVYLLPLIGAVVSDRLLGKYKTILWLSIVYCLGHLALAVFENPALQMRLFGEVYLDPIQGLMVGLGLIALGSGGIKPCVSAHVGDQFGKSNWNLLQKVYNIFYFIINFGSAFATIFIPLIRGKLGTLSSTGECIPLASGAEIVAQVCYTGSVSWAFGIPGILMGLATLFFWAGRHRFIHVPPNRSQLNLGVLDVLCGSFLVSMIGYPIFFSSLAPLWVTILISFGFLLLGIAAFSYRQSIEKDDGFLAILLYSASASYAGLSMATIGIVAFLDFFIVACGILACSVLLNVGDLSTPELLMQMGGYAGLALLTHHLRKLIAPTAGVWGAMGRSVAQARSSKKKPQDGFFGPALKQFGPTTVEGPIAVLKIISVFFLISVFWALFDQHGSTWVAQAKNMDRSLPLTDSGWLLLGTGVGLLYGLACYLSLSQIKSKWIAMGVCTIGGVALGLLGANYWDPANEVMPSQIAALNPFMVMLLIPYTTFGLYPLMKKLGIEPTPLRRITIGMVIASLAFVSVALLQQAMDASPNKIHVAWQLIPYTIITLAEVMVSITGLEFAYSQAPKSMKSVIMGFWLFNVTLGNLLVAFLAGFQNLAPAQFFWVFALLMGIAAILFGIRASFYTYKDYSQ